MRVLSTMEEQVPVDQINQKLLALLARNARFSYTTLAKQVKLSREAVKQRLERLQERKVLLGFQTALDPSKLGYSSHHLFVQLANPKKEAADAFIRQAREDPDVNALIQYHGQFDFELSLLLKDQAELQRKIQSYSNVRNYELCLAVHPLVAKTYPTSMSSVKLTEFTVRKDGSYQAEFLRAQDMIISLDAVDKKLLQELARDARISSLELSARLQLSVDAVIYRIKKLITSGVIKGFRPIINYAALGYSVYCLFFRFKGCTVEKEATFREFMQQHPHVLWSASCLGRFSNLSYIALKDPVEFHQVITEIREMFSEVLDAYESLLSFAEYKYTYFPETLMLTTTK